MDEKTFEKQDELEIDLQRLFGALLNKAWLIALVAIICAVVMFVGTLFLVTPTYQSAAMFYVNNSSLSLGEASLSISSADISASRGLVKSYIVILKTRETLNDVIDYAGVDLTYGTLKGMITAEAVDSTEIFRVVVTSDDPVEAEKIADAISYILPKRISNIIEGSSARVVDYAVLPSSPSSPSYPKAATIGFLIGAVLMAVLVIIGELMDVTIRTEEDITQNCKHPVLASVPDMESHGKSGYGYYYGYGKKKAYGKTATPAEGKKTELVGANISFLAAESYKLLRTKLQFSFADEGACRVIGVSSALTGEGKSLTAVNLAFSLSELGKRVLLIDCDMRRPSLAEKIPIKRFPGLSDYLSGQITETEMVQLCNIKGHENAFHAISSGRIPPNPMELLSSVRMAQMLAQTREAYDYVILDLPPVGEVSDALAVSKQTDGMLLVVRQNYCDRIALSSAIHQFTFVGVKILGLVYNCTNDQGGGYGNKYYRRYYRRYYKRYYHRYYRRYGGQYVSNEKKAQKK